MKIQDKDYYHGAALTQIVEHPSFTALNKADSKYGHYSVNHDIRLLIKHSTSDATPWGYTLNSTELQVLAKDIASNVKTFLCLVCGFETVCVLNIEQINTIVDLNASPTQWIRVEVPSTGSSMRAQGQKGEYRRTIPHNAFPDNIFE